MFDEHADEAIEAEIWLKAEAQGLEKGREQGLEEGRERERAKNEAANAKRAEYLRSQNIPEDVISAMLAIK